MAVYPSALFELANATNLFRPLLGHSWPRTAFRCRATENAGSALPFIDAPCRPHVLILFPSAGYQLEFAMASLGQRGLSPVLFHPGRFGAGYLDPANRHPLAGVSPLRLDQPPRHHGLRHHGAAVDRRPDRRRLDRPPRCAQTVHRGPGAARRACGPAGLADLDGAHRSRPARRHVRPARSARLIRHSASSDADRPSGHQCPRPAERHGAEQHDVQRRPPARPAAGGPGDRGKFRSDLFHHQRLLLHCAAGRGGTPPTANAARGPKASNTRSPTFRFARSSS